jgi:hypothetical protein
MSRTRIVALAFTTTTLTLSACGGSSQSSKPVASQPSTASEPSAASEPRPASQSSRSPVSTTRVAFIKQADAICRRANQRRDSLKHQHNTLVNFTTLAASENIEFAELAKLVAPASMTNDWNTIVGSGQAFAADLGRLANLARSKNNAAMRPLIQMAREAQERVLNTTKADGFKQCRQTAVHPADR